MNHITTNIITKGVLNISAFTKGIILPFAYEIVTKKRIKRGGGAGIKVYDDLKRDLLELQSEEIESIKVYVDWYKKVSRNKKIYVQLVKKQIQATLDETHKDNKIKIKIELTGIEIDDNNEK